MLKFDPYINMDPGTMSPTNGEVFVLDDGAECDLDLVTTNFLDQATRLSNVTPVSYGTVIDKERRFSRRNCGLSFTSPTDQIAPCSLPRAVPMAICEIGGTVGDIESLLFWKRSGS